LKQNTKRKTEAPDLYGPIAEASPMPMAAVEGTRHIIRYVNPAFCLFAGKSKEELIGNTFSGVVPAGDECLGLLDRIYRTGQSETHLGWGRSDSDSFYWSYSMWPVLGPDGRPGRSTRPRCGRNMAHPSNMARPLTAKPSRSGTTSKLWSTTDPAGKCAGLNSRLASL
jgi:PAS domain S-box-containing protein